MCLSVCEFVCVCVCVCWLVKVSLYLGFAIDSGTVLQQEVCHLCVAIVTGNVQRSVTHLHEESRWRERDTDRKDEQVKRTSWRTHLITFSFLKEFPDFFLEIIVQERTNVYLWENVIWLNFGARCL